MIIVLTLKDIIALVCVAAILVMVVLGVIFNKKGRKP